MFKDYPNIAPKETEQDYLWLAEYTKDSTCEYDLDTLKHNSFYEIEKEKLVRFGLIGRAKKMWFECSRGTFNILGKRIDVQYRVGDKVYGLTTQNLYQRDIITYKKAVSEADAGGRMGRLKNRILSYSYGYKSEMVIDGINFNFKPIANIPHGMDGGYQLEVSLVSDKDLNGQLEFVNGGEVVAAFDAPLVANVGGKMNWNIIF